MQEQAEGDEQECLGQAAAPQPADGGDAEERHDEVDAEAGGDPGAPAAQAADEGIDDVEGHTGTNEPAPDTEPLPDAEAGLDATLTGPPSPLGGSKHPSSPLSQSRSLLSPQPPAPRDPHLHQLIQVRLFSGDLGAAGPAGTFTPPARKVQSDPQARERLLAGVASPPDKKAPPPPLHPEYTFRPEISERSRKCAQTQSVGGERWKMLSDVAERESDRTRKIKAALSMREAKELEGCTFQPEISKRSHRIVFEQKTKGTRVLKRWNDKRPDNAEADGDADGPRGGGKQEAQKGSAGSALQKAPGAASAASPRKQAGSSKAAPTKSASPAPKPKGLGDPVFSDLHHMLKSIQL